MATEQQWKWLVRRAHGVPDVIGRTVAEEALRHRMPPRDDDSPTPEINEASGRILAAIIQLGAAGELDRALLADAGTVSRSEAVGKVLAATFGELSDTEDWMHVVPTAVLDRIRDYVTSHPTEPLPDRADGPDDGGNP